MAMYLLKGGEQVALQTRPLIIRLQSAGGSSIFRLKATVPVGEPIVVERQGMLVLPRIQQPTTVRILPTAEGQSFPPNSVLTAVIGPDGGNPDADYAQVSLDVSGLPQEDLVLCEPQGPTIKVTSLSIPHGTKLPPQAELARDVARELLGVAFDPHHAVDIVVGIDCSPSMRSYLADGAIEAALHTFAGMASVIDPNHEVEAVLCGRITTRLRSQPIDKFAVQTVAEVKRQPLVTGCRSSALRTGAKSLTYLVTDGVPADLRRRNDHPPHLAILAPRNFANLPFLPSSSPLTILPTDGNLSNDQVLWHREQVREIVDSLLASYRRPRKAQE